MKQKKNQINRKPSLFKKCLYFFTSDKKGRTHFKDPISAYQARPRRWIVNLVSFVIFVIVLIFRGNYIGIKNAFDSPINGELVAQRCHDFFLFDWDYFVGKGLYNFNEGVIYGCFVTLGITIIGTSVGFLLSIPFGFFASHVLFKKWALISEFILILIRTFPELLLALFFVALSGQTWLTAILCLSIHSIGRIGKLYADQLDEADLDGLEALDAQGAGPVQRVLCGVVPEVIPSFLSVGLYRLDINLRTATTLGLVLSSDAGIGFSILLDLSKNSYSHLGADTFGIVIRIILVDFFSSWLRKKIV